MIKSRAKNKHNRAFITLAMIAFLLVFVIKTVNINAEDSVKNEDVLGENYVGAAQDIDVDIVPTTEEVEKIIADNAWKSSGALVMANCNNSVNVREEASEESDKAGKLYSDCGGYIIEYTDEWTKLQSGELVGWVSNEYLLFGDAASDKANEVGCTRATVIANGVRIRQEASVSADVLDEVNAGEVLDVVEVQEEWIVVDYQGDNAYISAELADVAFDIDKGETMAAITAREEAEKAAQAKALAEKREAERKQYYGVYAANATDVELLGALIQCEAGNQIYEGQLAVGAVVMNRVRSGAYPNTIYGVIYASGQFTPAGTGAVDRRLANGVSSQCLQAAQEVINGYSPVGTAMHFRRAGVHDGIVIGGHVFW